ncbi:hypothetical protein SAMN06295967_10814 [Belliella buryatensis]|uniref:Calx-beta domain-containing protein n=1 Tax=Belliella buryatensis TaxID=1500549 RepID=A0A239DUS4_9BACT|nr:hypothetical protein [Belliella buryatensis]SNS35483.1 hypothetical protein SAMN06295967_10814 [Belliella buryatensis]
MKLNKLYSLMAVLLTMFATTACFDEPGTTILWDGVQVEWQNANLPNGVTRNFVRTSSTQVDVTEFQVNLVAAAQSSPITITVAADPASTAIEGVHYELPSSTITIPAGQNVVNFPIRVLTGNIDPSETPDLLLTMTTATGATIAENYKTLDFRIRVICPSDLAGTYTVFWERLQTGDGSGGAAQTATNFVINAANEVTVTQVATGVYQVNDMSFGMYPGIYSDSRPVGRFSDTCDVIDGASTNVDRYGDPFTIEGVVNSDDTITITWSNTWGDGGTVVLTLVED